MQLPIQLLTSFVDLTGLKWANRLAPKAMWRCRHITLFAT